MKKRPYDSISMNKEASGKPSFTEIKMQNETI